MKNLLLASFFTLVFFAALPLTSYAQLNNKPFAFKGTPDGGIGMSNAGRQLIMNQKITGATPGTVLKTGNGELITITKGTGGTAISTTASGVVLPTFKGTSYKGSNSALSVGTFNAYFVPGSGASGGGYGLVQLTSSAVVSTWTGRVVTGGQPVSYSPGSTVDAWTGMVFY